MLVPLNWRLAVAEQLFILSDASIKLLALLQPRLVHQSEGYARRLASAGRRDEDSRCACGQSRTQLAQDRVNRKLCGELHGGYI
jgi:hypothetical protein